MDLLADYQLIATLHEGHRSTLFRARRMRDDCPVVLKVPKSDYLDRRRVLELRREYAILRALPGEHVVRALEVEELPDRVVLILEDFGGMPLKQLLAERLKLPTGAFLDCAHKLAEALDAVHRRNIVHKDVKPQNILVNPASGVVKLGGFSSASSLAHEEGAAGSPGTSGTLAYMAPEQTGRMSLGVDCRADLYALGATFYEMLVGARPFTNQDPLELVHAHLAKTPPMPHEVEPSVPVALSRLVMKLLAKSPEDRYQSARGLLADLAECRQRLSDGDPLDAFALGRADPQRTFQLPQRVYGRSAPLALLTGAYERTCAGARALVLVSGRAGVGKTALINELHPRILVTRGRFIGGKCDQLNRATPFGVFAQAIGALIRQLLAEPAEAGAWARHIQERLGPNVKVLAEAVPEVQLLLGAQPAPAPLPAIESRNRLHFTLQRFVQLFTQAGQPLVIFLDDLQWADSATLSLLQHLTRSAGLGHLLLLGTYRDHDVGDGHPLWLMLAELEAARAGVLQLHLSPLEPEDVAAMVGESLGAALGEARPLAHLVHVKTGGNPLFIKEFLRFLHAGRLLTFDEDTLRWSWDLQRIEHHALPDNVAELMESGLRSLRSESVEALRVAACLGVQFDFRSLVAALGHSAEATAAALWAAVERGFVVPLHPDYRLLDPELQQALPPELDVPFRFLHDRVRQAAYSFLDARERDAAHVRIGLRLFHDARVSGRLEERLFAILPHLDFAPSQVEGDALRLQLADLHLAAGRQTKTSGAYRTACELLQGGLAFLPSADAWAQEPARTFDLHLELAECRHLVGEREASAAGFSELLQRARSRLEQARVHALRVRLACDSGQHALGVRLGLEGLRILGIELPETPDPSTVGEALAAFARRLGGRSAKDLLELPLMRDPEAEAAMALLESILAAAYQSNPGLLGLLVLRMLVLSLDHGNTVLSSYGYATYGLILAALDNPEEGAEFSQLAISLAERFNSPALHARARFVRSAFVAHWTRSIRFTIDELTEAYKGMLENGERLHAGYCIYIRQQQRLASGVPLQEELAEDEKFLDLLADKDPGPHYGLRENYRFVLALMGRELPAPQQPMESDSQTTLASLDITHADWNYTFGHYEKALEHAERAAPYAGFLAGMQHLSALTFLHALAMTACYDSVEEGRRRQFRETLATYEAAMHRRARRCAENYGQEALLVSAELARVDGRHAEALELYDRAIEAARASGFLSVEARANERAFRFHLGLGRRTIAGAYLLEALYVYERWGATGKVNQLARENAQLLLPWRLRGLPPGPGGGTSADLASARSEEGPGSLAPEALDLATVVKASQAISSEIKLSQLLGKLVRIAIENVGAQRGLLVLQRGQDFFVEVEGGGDAPSQEPVVLAESARLCRPAVYRALRTGEPVLLDDASAHGDFVSEPYIVQHRVRSLLCAPIVHQGRISGLFYLENNQTAGAFSGARLGVLRLLSGQTVISIENARLYERLEEYSRTLVQRVASRTAELNVANADLRRALDDVKAMQDRIILQEKLASLGALTAGIAHEIKNPLNFVNNFAALARSAAGELKQALQAQPLEGRVREEVEGYLSDITLSAQKVYEHGERADQIVNAMLLHSRGSGGAPQDTDLNGLVLQAVQMVQHGTRGELEVEVETLLDPGLPQVRMVSEDISRVLLNLLSNAFYAARQQAARVGAPRQPWVRVTTQALGERVELRVRDNGAGISAEVLGRIFTPFFTTKPPGEGTGLGLSISHDIVVKGHGGELRVQTEEGQYAEFIVSLPRAHGVSLAG